MNHRWLYGKSMATICIFFSILCWWTWIFPLPKDYSGLKYPSKIDLVVRNPHDPEKPCWVCHKNQWVYLCKWETNSVYSRLVIFWLVVDLPLWKIAKSNGKIEFPTKWKVIKFMFQTTNQTWWHGKLIRIFKQQIRLGDFRIFHWISPSCFEFLMTIFLG